MGTYLSEEQYQRLGHVLEQNEQNYMAARVIRFLTLTGCRLGEVLDLEWRDVRANHLALRDSKTGAKTLPIGAGAVQYLALQKSLLLGDDPARPDPCHNPNAVFPLPKLKTLRGHVRTRWTYLKREASLPDKVRLHDLRHSFASFGLTHGKSLHQIQKLLGHKDIETTERYAHLNDDALSAAAEKVGGWIMAAVETVSFSK
ncbi:MAG: site-specific integrase [Pseudomonadota bacterium]